MSITSRINEMSSHIEQAYDELQGLGADLTNVNKNIENISMVLDDIYDSMPQVSGEGTSLTLDDTRVGKIKSTLKGNTSQSGTPTPSSPIPVNVVSGDNTITISNQDGTDSNTYNIDLPEGMELCKIGDYQDYIYKDSDKWYLHKEIGKVVLDGSETWYRAQTNTTDYYRFFVDFGTNIQSGGASLKANVYSNKFIGISRDQSYGRYQGIAPTDINYTYKSLIIYCEATAQMTIADFKTWLSNNSTTVYYVYATPTTTEITYQPLIDQLNELEKAMSKDGQTNISQVNNDLPFIISASALKEWQESTSLNSTLSMVNPLSLGNTLNTQENNTQPIEVDNIEPLEEEENEES